MSVDDSAVREDPSPEPDDDIVASTVATKTSIGAVVAETDDLTGADTDEDTALDGPTRIDGNALSSPDSADSALDATGLVSAADLFADADDDDAADQTPAVQFADAGGSVEVDESVALGRPTWQMRRAARRLRARKVRRLVRYIDPWSVLKVSFLFYLCLFVILLLAGVLLWAMAVNAGTVASVESFIEDLFAFGNYSFDADLIFRASAIGGLVMVLAMTAMNVLLAILFNLISDLTGGLRFTVIEEETARPRPRRGRVFADPDDDRY